MAPRKTPVKKIGGEPVVGSISTPLRVDQTDLQMWVAEGKRLLIEAEARIESGDLLPALSSLAALPPLHRTLCECLSDIVNSTSQKVDQPDHCGMYL
jgi:hypothetical protein